jgi:hypothetical protein
MKDECGIMNGKRDAQHHAFIIHYSAFIISFLRPEALAILRRIDKGIRQIA